MHVAKRLYFKILKLCSLTESIIQPEPFSKDFCMFDLNTLPSMSFLLNLFMLLSVNKICHIFFCLHFGYF